MKNIKKRRFKIVLGGFILSFLILPSYVSAVEMDLKSIEIVDFVPYKNEQKQIDVKYAYKTDQLDFSGKDVTPNSYTEVILNSSEGNVYQTTIFAGEPQFYKDKDVWYQLEYATTTYDKWIEELPIMNVVRSFSIFPKVFAQSPATFYTSLNGYVKCYNTCDRTTWSDIINYPNATEYLTTEHVEYIRGEALGSPNYVLQRVILHFDTSSLPDSITISSAELSLYSTGVGAVGESTNPADLVLVTNETASEAGLVAGDYDVVNWGSTPLADNIPIATFYGTSAYHTFDLNPTGIEEINSTGVTSLGVRPANDVSGDAPTSSSRAEMYFSVEEGTTYDPKLVVTYTEGEEEEEPPVEFGTTTGATTTIAMLGSLNFGIAILVTMGFFMVSGFIFNNLKIV